jgi:hypothetical protein
LAPPNLLPLKPLTNYIILALACEVIIPGGLLFEHNCNNNIINNYSIIPLISIQATFIV